MPLFSRISRSIQDRVSDNPDGALAKYVWLWQSMGKRPGRRLIPRPIRFFFVTSLDVFSLVGWYVRTGILRVAASVGSKEAIMNLARSKRVAGLTILAGGVLGASLSFGFLGRSRSADEVRVVATPEMGIRVEHPNSPVVKAVTFSRRTEDGDREFYVIDSDREFWWLTLPESAPRQVLQGLLGAEIESLQNRYEEAQGRLERDRGERRSYGSVTVWPPRRSDQLTRRNSATSPRP